MVLRERKKERKKKNKKRIIFPLTVEFSEKEEEQEKKRKTDFYAHICLYENKSNCLVVGLCNQPRSVFIPFFYFFLLPFLLSQVEEQFFVFFSHV